MKKNKGFTLIELLAVIIVLGILLSVVGSRALKTKKKANESELQKQAKMLADLAPGIYSHEKIMNPSDNDTNSFMHKWKNTRKNASFYIKDDTLITAGYLDGKIKSPYKGTDCSSYLEFYKNSNENGDYKYIGHISCDNGKHVVDSEGTSSWDIAKYNSSTNLTN